jgi:hypothetical protein
MGIMSELIFAVGLPMPESEVPDSEGEREYWRVSAEMDGTLMDAEAMR